MTKRGIEPMTKERLEEIRHDLNITKVIGQKKARELIAEIDRLRSAIEDLSNKIEKDHDCRCWSSDLDAILGSDAR